MGDPESPAVTVVVPVRHDVAGLRDLIASLRAQTLDPAKVEVVVGADGAAPDFLAGVESSDGLVLVVHGPARNSYAARNRAARAARGDVLAFCDSDCRPEADWLERGLSALERADLVAGEVCFVAPARPTAWSLLTVDAFLDQQSNVQRSRAVTANLFLRRRLFEALEGFDESLPSGGDWDLAERAVGRGWRLAYAPDVVVRHPTLDRRPDFLSKLRTVNRCAFVRSGRSGRRRDLLGLMTLVPLVGPAVTRRHNSRPALRLSRRRLRASGLHPSLRAELRALFLLYFVAAPANGLARARGWRAGRRAASASARHRAEGTSSRDSGRGRGSWAT